MHHHSKQMNQSTSVVAKRKRRSWWGRQQNQMCIRFTVLALTILSAHAFSRSNSLCSPWTHPARSKSIQPLESSSNPTSSSSDNETNNNEEEEVLSFDAAVKNRYACTRYQRHDGIYDHPDAKTKPASPADPRVVTLAKQALELATRAPTGFNVQPYKLLLVESVQAKQALARYCIGRNRDRVLDSDCSVVFLADRQAMASWKDYKTLLLESPRNQQKTPLAWLKLRALVALFSSGIPLPKVLAGPISFGLRLAMRVVSWVFRDRLVVPTLSSPECWSQKNTMLVASAYLLGCSARGLDTTPMEGYLSWGIRNSLKIPRRYTIPLVVSTGRAYANASDDDDDEADDAGMSHGTRPETATPRYPTDAVVHEAFPP